MKILQLISSGGFYGAEAMLLHLSIALRNKGHQVRLGVFLNRNNPHDEIARRARHLDVEVKELRCGGKLDFSTVRALRRYVAESGSEIVHSHGYKSNLYALAANIGARRVLVSTCHNWTEQTTALRTYRRIDCLGLRLFHRVFCVSQEVQHKLLQAGVSQSKLAVILNGIPLSDFSGGRDFSDPGSERPLTIGMVGRLVEDKGFHLVLQCAPALLKQFPNTRFVLAGDGPKREAWTDLVRTLGIESHVAFAGVQTDMPGFYRSLDVLVLPSFNEGMPMTILEAMAAGIPVVATTVGSIPEMIRHEETGLLIQKNDVAGLQRALERLIGDAELRGHLARSGHQFVSSNASIERVADQYVDHYGKLIQ